MTQSHVNAFLWNMTSLSHGLQGILCISALIWKCLTLRFPTHGSFSCQKASNEALRQKTHETQKTSELCQPLLRLIQHIVLNFGWRTYTHIPDKSKNNNKLNYSIYWVITRSKVVWNRRFGTTYRLHLWRRRFLNTLTLEDGTDR